MEQGDPSADDLQPLKLQHDLEPPSGLSSPYELPPPPIWWLLLEPLLIQLGLYTPPDPTYGRYLLPLLEREKVLFEDPTLVINRRRVFVDNASGEDVSLTSKEVASGKDREGGWIYYQTWEKAGVAHVADLHVVHGYCDYGSRWIQHTQAFLASGYRIIALDLPAHGHSTGIHGHLKNPQAFPNAMKLVIDDTITNDNKIGRSMPSKRFVSGTSLGGWSVLSYLMNFPPSVNGNPSIDGAFVFCPMVKVAPHSRPSMNVERVARIVEFIAGRFPAAAAHRGNSHRDPRVEADFLANHQCYHGPLRVGTGLNFLRGMDYVDKNAELITVPIQARHGDLDRVTSHLATKEFIDRTSSTDKKMVFAVGYEHVMHKVGVDEADDKMRQDLLKDWKAVLDAWL